MKHISKFDSINEAKFTEKEAKDFIKKHKTGMKSVEVPMDFTANVKDYHEFETIQDTIEEYLGIKYNYEEIGCSGEYEALFWIGKKPTDLIKALKKTYEEE